MFSRVRMAIGAFYLANLLRLFFPKIGKEHAMARMQKKRSIRAGKDNLAEWRQSPVVVATSDRLISSR